MDTFLLPWRMLKSLSLAHLVIVFLTRKILRSHALAKRYGGQIFHCQSARVRYNSLDNASIMVSGDCGQLSSISGVYRILNQTNNSFSVGFQCVHTPYQIDPVFTTQCQAGQWDPHPRDVCRQDLTGMIWLVFNSVYHCTCNNNNKVHNDYFAQGRLLLYRWEHLQHLFVLH